MEIERKELSYEEIWAETEGMTVEQRAEWVDGLTVRSALMVEYARVEPGLDPQARSAFLERVEEAVARSRETGIFMTLQWFAGPDADPGEAARLFRQLYSPGL